MSIPTNIILLIMRLYKKSSWMIYAPDLIFAPTLACEIWILYYSPQVLLLSCAMLTYHVCLRGSFCPQLAWIFNHRHAYTMHLLSLHYIKNIMKNTIIFILYSCLFTNILLSQILYSCFKFIQIRKFSLIQTCG